jgi:NhaP-type Na+/H+ or K+/H+ antiporter
MPGTLTAVSVVLALGAAAQVASARLRMPSILLLLASGLLAGPGMRWLWPDGWSLRPDELLGDILSPLAALSVGLILYEGGLTLRFKELGSASRTLWMLISLGAAVTALLAAIGARLLLGLPWELAAVFGALLTVSGPTVVLPLVRHIRPTGPTGPILRWEGIVIDPVGASLAVLVYEVVMAGDRTTALADVLYGIVNTLLVGGGLGLFAGWAVAAGIRRYLIPDSLQNLVSLAAAACAFTLADLAQKESGLLATTVMGMVIANQRGAETDHILEFKENLRVLLISALFVLLAARLEHEQIEAIGLSSIAFVAFLVLVVRPAAVALSTIGSGLRWRNRVFLACVAPRGIVAAAVMSVLAADLAPRYPEADTLVPVMFAVIIGTVLIYGLFAGPAARWLGLSDSNPQGVLILGGQPWARAIAATLGELNIRAMIVDSNLQNTEQARSEGVPAYHGSILSESAADDIALTGIGRFIAMTANDQVNTMAALRMSRLFGRAAVYQIAPKRATSEESAIKPAGRLLSGDDTAYARLAGLWSRGGGVITTRLSSAYTLDAFREDHGEAAVPLLLVSAGGRLTVLSPDQQLPPARGATLVSLVAHADGVLAMQRARNALEVEESEPPTSGGVTP